MRLSAVAAAAVAALTLGALVAMPAEHPETASASRPARTVPVERVTVVCPPMPGSDDTRASTAVVSPQLPDLATRDRRTRPVRIRARGKPLGRIRARGETWAAVSSGLADGLTARATGALAPGLTGVTSAELAGDRRSGRATTACVQPGSEWWFVGAGSSVGRAGSLVLTNPGTGIAVADVTFQGPDGVMDIDTDQIGLGPGQQRVLDLDDFAPGVRDVAIRVVARQGKVAAAVSETYVEASHPAGADFIGAAAPPATEAVVTGIPARADRRTLTVVNAGDTETIVELEVLGATGAFAPSDFDALRVPASSVVRRDVTEITGDEESGLRVRADQPISASVAAVTEEPADVSHAPAGVPLTSASAVAIPDGLDARLMLTAGRTAVAVDLAVFDSEGRAVGEETIELGAGQTAGWRVEGNGEPASVVVRSDQGSQLVGAVRWTGDGGTSTTPLQPLRVSVVQPPLTYDPVGP